MARIFKILKASLLNAPGNFPQGGPSQAVWQAYGSGDSTGVEKYTDAIEIIEENMVDGTLSLGTVLTPYDAGQGFYVVATSTGVVVTEPVQGEYLMSIPEGTMVFNFWKTFAAVTELTNITALFKLTVNWNTAAFNTSFTDAVLPGFANILNTGVETTPGDSTVTVTHTAPAAGVTVTTLNGLGALAFPTSIRGTFV